MADLPSGVLYGTVVGQFIQAVVDAADPNREPDMLPMQGKVVIAPTAPRVKLPFVTPNPVTMFQQAVTLSLDSNGYLISPDGQQGVRLIASNSPGDPTDFTYTAAVELVGVSPFSFSFYLPAGSVLDLTTAIPADPSSGIVATADGLVATILGDPASASSQAVATKVDSAVIRPVRGLLGTGLVPVSPRYPRFDFSGRDTTNNTMVSKITHTMIRAGLILRAAYYNAAPGPITLRGSVNQAVQITWAGAASVTIPARSWAISDEIIFPHNAGDAIAFWTHLTRGGTEWHFTHLPAANIDGVARGTDLADITMGGALSNSGSGMFAPAYILTEWSGEGVTTGLGDSIMGGEGSTGTTARNFLSRALAGRSFFIANRSGETAQAYVNRTDVGSTAHTDPLPTSRSRYELAIASGWLAGNYGINDIRANRTAEQYIDDCITIWKRHQGQRIAWFTLLPNSGSTDAYATVTNQTVNATQGPRRVTANQYFRAGAPLDPTTLTRVAIGTPGALLVGHPRHLLARVLDIAPAVESSLDSGRWKALHTGDGLHPNDTGHQAIADLLTTMMAADPALFS
ncbi:MAG: YapH protein [Microbacterium sp.]|jgi:hypothetical protein|nr:YapH protein [Microbacterium sp.]